MFEEEVPLWILIIVVSLLIHIVSAIVGSVVLSTIPRRIYNEKFVVLGMCWFVPLFSVLLITKDGKYVPMLGPDTYQSAREKATTEYQAELEQHELARSINERDSAYGGSSSGYGGGDAGGD